MTCRGPYSVWPWSWHWNTYLHFNCPQSENLHSIKSLSVVDSSCVFQGKVEQLDTASINQESLNTFFYLCIACPYEPTLSGSITVSCHMSFLFLNYMQTLILAFLVCSFDHHHIHNWKWIGLLSQIGAMPKACLLLPLMRVDLGLLFVLPFTYYFVPSRTLDLLKF